MSERHLTSGLRREDLNYLQEIKGGEKFFKKQEIKNIFIELNENNTCFKHVLHMEILKIHIDQVLLKT